MTTGERIRKLRIAQGLSQEALGARIGVQKAAIHKYESGMVVNLKQSTLKALADALETTPAHLLGIDRTLADTAKDDALRLLGALDAQGRVDAARVRAIADLLDALARLGIHGAQ